MKQTRTYDEEECREAHEKLRTCRMVDFALGEVLSQIKERKLYPPYTNFVEVVDHLADGMNVRTADRHIFAYRMYETFKRRNCRFLPNAEGQVRLLERVRSQPSNPNATEDLRVRCWELACTLTANPPPSEGVVRQAIKLVTKPRPIERERGMIAEIQKYLGRAQSALFHAERIMREDPDFAELLKRHDREAELVLSKLILREESLAMAIASQMKRLMGMPDFPKSTDSQPVNREIQPSPK